MKQEEVIWRCGYCGSKVYYLESKCFICDNKLLWSGINKIHSDKFLDIYEIQVK